MRARPPVPVRLRETNLLVDIGGLVLLDIAVATAWTAWWNLGEPGAEGPWSLPQLTWNFLSWTFLPCWGVALALLGITWRWTRRARPWEPAATRAVLTLLAPALWSFGFCYHYDELDYVPVAMLVSTGAWIVTLQPLWAYLIMHRLHARR